MSRTVSPSSGRAYGLTRVCRVWKASRATVYRHLAPPSAEPPRRPGPVGPMPDAALVEVIRAVLAASPFHGEGHRKVWARLPIKKATGLGERARFVKSANSSTCSSPWRSSQATTPAPHGWLRHPVSGGDPQEGDDDDRDNRTGWGWA